MTSFRLKLIQARHSIGGSLTIGTRTVAIRKGFCSPDSCSFEVQDNPEEEPAAWKVWIDEGLLRGIRNKGPLNPLGIGAGARLFDVYARREFSK